MGVSDSCQTTCLLFTVKKTLWSRSAERVLMSLDRYEIYLADLNIGMSIFRNHFWSKYGKCLKITISWLFLLINSMFYSTDCLCLWAANDAQLVPEYWGCFSNDTRTFSDRYEVLLDRYYNSKMRPAPMEL